MNIFKPWTWRKKPDPAPPVLAKPKGVFSTHELGDLIPSDFVQFEFKQPEGAPAVTSDALVDDEGFHKGLHGLTNTAQLGFYAASAYPVGYQACAMMSTNWLIDKACSIPARDAVRQGWSGIPSSLRTGDGQEKYDVTRHLRELVHLGRVYGGRLVLFVVDHENPDEWYKNPFNIDGVKKGTYRGMSQIDPNWVTPVLTEKNLNDPASQEFYEPTYWEIKGRRVHRSHLHIFVPYPVPDFLKPSYNYLGVSVPQRIMERVYAAERSANEAPQLLMTKRTIVAKMNESAFANLTKLREKLRAWSSLMTNFGIWAIGKEEDVSLNDTSLADVDTTMMSQYQLVSSAANVPATKLLNVQPKGFNSTGEYEESSYREELESIQANDLTQLLTRHYRLVARSEELPFTGKVIWEALDSPTRKEFAEIEKYEADRDKVLFDTGAIDGEDIRNRIRKDPEGSYHGIEEGEYGKDPNGQAGQMGAGETDNPIPRPAAFPPSGRPGEVPTGT